MLSCEGASTVSEANRRPVCTIDHAGKQRDAVGWNDHEFWLAVVRRRKAAIARAQKRRDPAADRSRTG